MQSILQFLISLFIFSNSISCNIIQIERLVIQNFTQFSSVKVDIDEIHLGKQLIIEVTFSTKKSNSVRESSFIFLSAEPGISLPDIVSVQFQQKIQQYESKNIHLDIEGYSTMRKFQQVNILPLTETQIGEWNLGFYDLKSDKTTLNNIDINVYVQEENNIYCPETCNQYKTQYEPTNKQNKCNEKQGNSKEFCNCADGYIGYNCYFNSLLTEVDKEINIKVTPLTWNMRSFNISEYEDSKFSLVLTGTNTKLKMSIVYGTVSDIWVPNILYDQYDISPSITGEQEEYPPLQEKLKKMFDDDTLLAIRQKYPNHKQSYDQVLTVGFYNQNPTEEASFIFKLREVDTVSEDISGINKTTMILFIIFGCVIIFCVTPITYFCVKQKKKQEQDFLNQILNNNPLSAQPNSNQLRQGIASGSQLNQQRGSGNPNQNEILEQLNSPIMNLVVGAGNQLSHALRNGEIQLEMNGVQQLQAPIAQIENMEVERLKPIKKIVPITKETINRFMPKQKYSDVIRLYPTLKDEGEECTVCLEAFEQSSECRITPCYHLFHTDCLESWFQKHSTCPYCRNACNRKGIIKQLQQAQRNSYVKRMQQPFAKEKANSKQIKSDGDVEVDELDTNRILEDLQNPQTHSPGRRPNELFNSPEKKDEERIQIGQGHNSNEKAGNGQSSHNIARKNSNNNNSNNTGNKLYKKPSIVESVLQVINKPFQQKKDSQNINSIKSGNLGSPKKSKDENQPQVIAPFNLNKDNNNNNNNNNMNMFLASNNSINRMQNNNNNPILSINCLSQNAFMDQGNEIFSFISPNLSQMQQQPGNDILFSLNNSIQKRHSFAGEQDRQSGVLSPENSFQMVSTTRKMFAEQEYMNRLSYLNSQKMNQDKEINNDDDYDRQFDQRRFSNNNISHNFDRGDDFISYNRYRQNSIEQGKKLFLYDTDQIDNYGNGNIGNDDDENGTNMMTYKKNKNQLYVLSGSNAVIKKPMAFSEKKQNKNQQNEDPSNLPQTEYDISARANQIPLPSRNILTSQPRFFQESNRRESIRLNNTQNSEKSRNKMSFIGENVQNTSINKTIDDQRYGNKTLKIHSNRFQEDVNNSIPLDLIQLSSKTTSIQSKNKSPQPLSDQQFNHIQVVNKLIVLDDQDDDDDEDCDKRGNQINPHNLQKENIEDDEIIHLDDNHDQIKK